MINCKFLRQRMTTNNRPTNEGQLGSPMANERINISNPGAIDGI
jgi:hypothetical protein